MHVVIPLQVVIYTTFKTYRLTERERLPTPNEETDTSDSEEEEIVESEEVEEEEEQQKENEEEEALAEHVSEEDLETVSDDSFEEDGRLNISGRSPSGTETGGTEDSALSVTLQREDSHAISEYKSDDEYQFRSDSDLGSDDAAEEHELFKMSEAVSSAQHSSSMDLQAQYSPTDVHHSITGGHVPELDSPVGLDDVSDDEFLSASSGDEEMFDLLEQSQTVQETHQTEIVPVQETTVTQAVIQKQLATDLPCHQIQDSEDTLEQVIDLPEQTQAGMSVRQSKTSSEQGEMRRSVWVEEAPPSAQLPGPSPTSSVKTTSSTMQGEQSFHNACNWLN